MKVDAIVNSTSSDIEYIGGTESDILSKGGNNLLLDRKNLGIIDVSEARYTIGYDLSAKFVIHTVGPTWTGSENDEYLLIKTYNNVLSIADKLGCSSIAFPLISTGINGYPKKEALKIAHKVIRDFLEEKEMMIYLVVYDNKSYSYSEEMFDDVNDYIQDNLVTKHSRKLSKDFTISRVEYQSYKPPINIENRLKKIDKGFSDTLIELIVRSEEKPSTIYKRANVTKQLYSKIKLDKNYHPSKQIAICFAISLKLNVEESNDLLGRAGYKLSNSILFDVIIKYCLENQIYDIFLVNEILFDKDQTLLGSTMN